MSRERFVTGRRGFSLLELLAVVGIIAVLLALVGGVGIAVIGQQKVSQTQKLLHTLDRALEEYITVTGGIPPYITAAYDRVPGENNNITDDDFFKTYRGVDQNPLRPDAAVFLKQAMGVGDVQAIISGIPEQFLVVTINGPDLTSDDQDVTPSIIDVWGNEFWPTDADNKPWDITRQQVIYYVHPDNRLAQDLFGQCMNRRPYFFSAGPDLKYGFRSEVDAGAMAEEVEALLEDNIYSYDVGPINRDSDFFLMYR